jgi:hypothetical protein
MSLLINVKSDQTALDIVQDHCQTDLSESLHFLNHGGSFMERLQVHNRWKPIDNVGVLECTGQSKTIEIRQERQ